MYFFRTEHRSKIYDRPYARMGPYLVGMYTGYLLYKTGCKWKVNKVSNSTIKKSRANIYA